LVLGLVACGGLTACGGRAIEQPGSGGEGPSTPAPASTGNGSAGKSNSPSSFPSHALATCTPGFVRAEHFERPCHWLTESGQCFDELNAACACVCPRDRDSVCWSDFDDGPDSATFVGCS
jgi:hypothetical protein